MRNTSTTIQLIPRLLRVVIERNPYGKPGWILRMTFGRGAGYRAIDLPGYRQGPRSWRNRLYIAGRTMSIGRGVKMTRSTYPARADRFGHVFGKNETGTRGKFYITLPSKSANRNVFPGWW